MSHATSAARPLTVRVGTALAAVLGTVEAWLLMTAMHWPGLAKIAKRDTRLALHLAKIAGLLAVAYAAACAQEWRAPAETSRGGHLASAVGLAGTVLLALVWPALPGEAVTTVAVVATLALGHSVNVELVLHHRRAGR